MNPIPGAIVTVPSMGKGRRYAVVLQKAQGRLRDQAGHEEGYWEVNMLCARGFIAPFIVTALCKPEDMQPVESSDIWDPVLRAAALKESDRVRGVAIKYKLHEKLE